jgi:hypothetical protein
MKIDPAQIAAGFGISVGAAHAYAHTVIDLLAHRRRPATGSAEPR